MTYIDSTPNPSGAYPNAKHQPFPGCIELNDEQAAVFFAYNGFVTVTTDPVTVEPNTEAWEAWKASLPEPEIVNEPTVEERVTELEDALAQTDETAIALYEAQAEQEMINAAQDEALIELYEMMEG